MLERTFDATVPMLSKEHGGEVAKLVGDAIMVTFNAREDRPQPDHARRAARAGLSFQRAAAAVAARHSDWPRFRVGINTGEADVALVGAEGKRGFDVTGDAVNVAARLEGKARAGEVVIGAETRRSLGEGADVEELGDVEVKGKEARVRAYLLRALARGGREREERVQSDEEEARR